jgi:hypothetical protein
MKKLLWLLPLLCPMLRAQCPQFSPVDIFVHMNGTSVGTNVTTTNLNTGTDFGSSGDSWFQIASPTGTQKFAASQITLPATVTVNGGGTYTCGTATQSLSHAGSSNFTTSAFGVAGSHQNVTVSAFLTTPPNQTPSGNLVDEMLVEGNTTPITFTTQFNSGNSGEVCGAYGGEIEKSGGTTVHSGCYTPAASTLIFVSMHVNYTSTGTCFGAVAAPCAELAAYNVSGGVFTQIGSTISVAGSTDHVGSINFGNNEQATFVNTLFFQDMMVDYTNHVFPNIPPNVPPWTGVLSQARAIDWSRNNAGVVGGIPSASWTQCVTSACNTVTSAGVAATAAQINAALASATSDTYVLLATGTYSLNATLVMQPNVVLRGAGPNLTSLVFASGGTYGTPCGLGAQVCFIDSLGQSYSSTSVEPGGTNSATFCGDATSGSCNNTYHQGDTTVQLSNVGSTGVVNGQYINLDQINDNPTTASSNTSGLIVCDNQSATDGCSLEGGAPGRCSTGAGGSPCVSGGGIDRNLIQIVQVVSGCASACTGAGPFTVTITPGLYSLKWNTSQSPGAWWSANNMQNSGIENLSIDSTAVGTASESAIWMHGAFNCWVLNVRSISPNRNHVWFWGSAHDTVQSSYFFGTQSTTSQAYGVESFISSDNLVINNIFQQVTAPIEMGPSQGSVFAYNFAINDVFNPPPTWMQQAFSWRHDAGVLYNLSEGNLSSGYWSDVFHGNGGANTAFRNYAVGWQSGKTQETVPVQSFSYNREDNFIGNVLGCNNATSAYPGNCGSPYHTTYQSSTGVGAAQIIYDLGAGNSESGCGSNCTVLADSYVATSLMRWGNYDVVNAANRFVSSEVPSGLTDGYANPVPGSTTLPASFYSASTPSFWGGRAWPGVGPDVTTGTVPGLASHVALNPAADCFLNTMGGPADGSGSVLPFAENCAAIPPPNTWHIRLDGGTNTQCTGLANAAYPGSGSGLACAYNHPFQMLNFSGNWTALAAGDTIEFDDPTTNTTPYYIGEQNGGVGQDWSGPLGGICPAPNSPDTSGRACTFPGFPNNVTIKGQNYDGDHGACHNPFPGGLKFPTILSGINGVFYVLPVGATNGMAVSCIEITQPDSCTGSGATFGPGQCVSTSNYVQGHGLLMAFQTAQGPANFTLTDFAVVGLSHNGITGSHLNLLSSDTFTASDIYVIGNGFNGWDGDGGGCNNSCESVGTMNVNHLLTELNGCLSLGRPYNWSLTPVANTFNYCYGQSTSGSGDNFVQIAAGSGFVMNITNSISKYGAQDCWDGAHLSDDITTNPTTNMSNLWAEGCAGQTFKVGAGTGTTNTAINNVSIDNCRILSTASAFPLNPSGWTTLDSGDTCRAGGDHWSMTSAANTTIIMENNTSVGYGNVMYDFTCNIFLSSCPGAAIIFTNNLSKGYPDPGNSGRLATGIFLNTNITTSNISGTHNLWDTTFNGCPDPNITDPNVVCADPLLVSESNIDAINPNLTSSSPAIGAGLHISGITTDYNGTARPNPPAIGAFELLGPVSPPTKLQGVILKGVSIQ